MISYILLGWFTKCDIEGNKSKHTIVSTVLTKLFLFAKNYNQIKNDMPKIEEVIGKGSVIQIIDDEFITGFQLGTPQKFVLFVSPDLYQVLKNGEYSPLIPAISIKDYF